MEKNKLEHSNEVLYTHSKEDCKGEFCCIHNRSDHCMRSFRQHWRDDRSIMERICPHGIGHPDPDQNLSEGGDIHGCDGCCSEEKGDKKE